MIGLLFPLGVALGAVVVFYCMAKDVEFQESRTKFWMEQSFKAWAVIERRAKERKELEESHQDDDADWWKKEQ